jgi:hypothetical protein
MALEFKRTPAQSVNDEWDNLTNVVCEVIAVGLMGFDTVVGYIYIDADGKPRKHWCGWL